MAFLVQRLSVQHDVIERASSFVVKRRGQRLGRRMNQTWQRSKQAQDVLPEGPCSATIQRITFQPTREGLENVGPESPGN